MKSKLQFSPAHNVFNSISFFIALAVCCVMTIGANTTLFAQNSSIVRAGLRSSVYGFNSFPDTTWWFNATGDMASRFSGASPSVIWILGYTTNDGCYLNFSKPNTGLTYDKISFAGKDGNEAYLNFFDRKGIKVWLQVEPGMADVLTLIDLALNQYKHHPCVVGFGVDVEWYKTAPSNNDEGEAVTDAEAEAWSARIKSYNENYLLFTKHWLISKMPPTFRTDIVFVDDSQDLPNMNSMIDEFADWANAFAPAKVAFQFGYDSDKPWWGNLSDPPKGIGDALIARCSNISDLYWVDFTAYDIWPKNFTPTSVSKNNESQLPDGFSLSQNYPNPFNPVTIIKYTIAKEAFVSLKVYDVLGKQIASLVNDHKQPGNYEVNFDGSSLASGIYYYRLTAGSFSETKKFVLAK